MQKMKKPQFEEYFKENVLPFVIRKYERDGVPDRPARREEWNNTVDFMIKEGQLPESAGNWTHPNWLETWYPPGGFQTVLGNPKAGAWFRGIATAALAALGITGIVMGRRARRNVLTASQSFQPPAP